MLETDEKFLLQSGISEDDRQVVQFEERLAAEYGGLSKQLKAAADYIVKNQVDTATRSLRSISEASDISPATYSRLARALGFANYEELREMLRGALGRSVSNMTDKATRLQQDALGGDQTPFLNKQSAACAANIGQLTQNIPQDRLQQAVRYLNNARNVLLLGSLSSTGIVEYMAYLANYFTDHWRIAGRAGASLGAEISALNKNDVLLVVTKPPFARRTIEGVRAAARMGAKVIVITDTHSCPVLAEADTGFIVATDSPQFFSSYAATIVLIETIIGMLVAGSGKAAKQRIFEVECLNQQFGETWSA
jgi:DNA-binding MurR/RpiR family transcriptional regulator